MTKQRLQEIRERLQKATPGPWFPAGSGYEIRSTVDDTEDHHGSRVAITFYGVTAPEERLERALNDGEFIAHAWQDIHDLLETIEQQTSA